MAWTYLVKTSRNGSLANDGGWPTPEEALHHALSHGQERGVQPVAIELILRSDVAGNRVLRTTFGKLAVGARFYLLDTNRPRRWAKVSATVAQWDDELTRPDVKMAADCEVWERVL